jgi:predicted HicB family RNase H-like nuclease
MSTNMSKNPVLEYKGYVGSAEVDLDDGILHGTVQGINDVVHYEGNTVEELRQAFRDSVDEYLRFCEECGDEPQKPYSGRFVARVDEELHRRAAAIAAAEGISLNDLVNRAIHQHTATSAPAKQAPWADQSATARPSRRRAAKATSRKVKKKRS